MTLASEELGDVLIIGIIGIVAIVLVAGPVIFWLRRRALMGDGGAEPGFSVERLQELRASGEISEEEFQQLRRATLGLAEEAAEKDSSRSSAPGDGDDEEDREGNLPPLDD